MPLFGQILAALYQEDIVEEDDIRAWHKLPIAQGEGRKPGPETENLQRCLTIGAHMIRQFDEQESDSEEEESEDEVLKAGKVVAKPVKVEETPETTEESESEDDDSKSSGDVSKEADSTDVEEDGESSEDSEE
jgi:translation initiation factor eIF-2B subunit epsilon